MLANSFNIQFSQICLLCNPTLIEVEYTDCDWRGGHHIIPITVEFNLRTWKTTGTWGGGAADTSWSKQERVRWRARYVIQEHSPTDTHVVGTIHLSTQSKSRSFSHVCTTANVLWQYKTPDLLKINTYRLSSGVVYIAYFIQSSHLGSFNVPQLWNSTICERSCNFLNLSIDIYNNLQSYDCLVTYYSSWRPKINSTKTQAAMRRQISPRDYDWGQLYWIEK